MKKIQKQYQRKIRVSQNNDVFTTFQRHSTSNCSTNKVEKSHKSHSFHQNQHEHIQSLKSTLRSLMPASLQMTKHFSRNIGIESLHSEQRTVQNDQYKFKLDQLTKNLEQIASKCHFSPANVTSNKYQQSSFHRKDAKAKPLFQKSQTLSRYEPIQPIQSELFYRYSNNTSIQIPKNKSQSFIEKQDIHHSVNYKSPLKPQNQGKNAPTHEICKSKEKSKSKKNYNDGDSNKKKSLSKKEVIYDSLGITSANKNLTKLFQTIDNNTIDMFKGRERSQTQYKKYQKIFQQKIHRAKITNIIVTDQIYTSSLDYSIKKTEQNSEGKYQSNIVQHFRGGVEYIGIYNSKIYGCGRDYYLRSIDGNYFCKFDKIPLSFSQTQKSNNININFVNSQLKLFDLEKRQFLSSILIENKYSLFNKVAKENYIGLKNSLFALDWRKREHLVNVYKDIYKDNITWLSDPFSKTFWYHSEGELTILNSDFKKKGTKNIPFHHQFVNYHWGRSGLNILSQEGQGGFKVHHYQQFKQRQQLDCDYESSQLTHVLIRDKQLIYCSKSGQLIIKSNRK